METKVLIVDDSTMSRKILKRALPPEWNVSISEASNGVEALEAYHKGKAEVMFLDLTMPELDGYGVLEALKDESAKACIFVVSADIQPEAFTRVMSLGAMAFIQKPITPERMKEELLKVGLL